MGYKGLHGGYKVFTRGSGHDRDRTVEVRLLAPAALLTQMPAVCTWLQGVKRCHPSVRVYKGLKGASRLYVVGRSGARPVGSGRGHGVGGASRVSVVGRSGQGQGR